MKISEYMKLTVINERVLQLIREVNSILCSRFPNISAIFQPEWIINVYCTLSVIGYHTIH